MHYKGIFEVRSGNMIGVVEEPNPLDPAKPVNEQRLVKIGVIDPDRARREPFSRPDANIVVEKLREFLTTLSEGDQSCSK